MGRLVLIAGFLVGLVVSAAAALAAPGVIQQYVAQCDPDAATKCAQTCNLHVKYDASDNGSITLVTGSAGKKVYICGMILAVGGTATNLKLVEGTNANCAAGSADVTPAYQIAANQSTGFYNAIWGGLATAATGNYLCINASAGNAHQAEVWYSQQ